jgi:hypothetical protein
MINFKYTNPKDAVDNSPHQVNGGLFIEIETSPLGVEFPWSLPLTFRVLNTHTKKVIWESQINPGGWSTFPWGFESTVIVTDADDNIVFNWIWDPLIHGDEAHRFFTSWAMKNKGSKGIAIGTHDGMTGEWTTSIRKGYLEGYLVEASSPQYLNLVENYKSFENAYPILSLVTPDGGQVEFFQGGEGHSNSVIKEHALTYIDNINSVLLNSISLNDLISNLGLANDIKWLHLDVEGLDSDLIMSLDDSKVKMPEVIIFESLNLKEVQTNEINQWLTNKGYKLKVSGWNTIAYRK